VPMLGGARLGCKGNAGRRVRLSTGLRTWPSARRSRESSYAPCLQCAVVHDRLYLLLLAVLAPAGLLLGLAELACAAQTSTMAYGAFCDIKCSTDGLIHISQLGVRGAAPPGVACTSL